MCDATTPAPTAFGSDLQFNNISCPLFIDELNFNDPFAPSLIQTIPVYGGASEANLPCTMFPRFDDASGGLSVSRSGKVVTLLCWSVPAGQVGLGSASFPAASFPRVIARITQDGAVSTTQRLTDAFQGTNQALLSAILDDTISPLRYWVTGSPLTGTGGLRMVAAGSTTTIGIATGGTYRTLVTADGALYVPYSATK